MRVNILLRISTIKIVIIIMIKIKIQNKNKWYSAQMETSKQN